MFLRRRSQWNNQKHKRKSPRVSLKPAAMKHFCLPGSGKHTARHHSCKMSSGASSKAERLTLIHKQLPLSLCCRFRTAVPPNISLSCLANIERKKKDSTSAFSPQKKRQTQKLGRKARPSQIKRGGKKTKVSKRRAQKNMQYLVFYVNEIAGWHTNVSVNGSKAFLPLQGNPLGSHGLIQWAASSMTHSGEACRIVEETIPDAGVHFVFSRLTPSDLRCLHNVTRQCSVNKIRNKKHIQARNYK